MKIIFYAILGFTFALLALTGYTGPFTVSGIISGDALLLHAALAPVFSLIIAAWALVYAPRNRFNETDWLWLLHRDEEKTRIDNGLVFGKKICFWLVILTAVPSILSIVLNMFPFIPAGSQVWLLRLHLVSVILLTSGILGYAGCSWAQMNPDTYFERN